MKLTPQQLHIMQRARKDLTFGCIIQNGTKDNPGDERAQYIKTNFAMQTVVAYNGHVKHYEDDYMIIGHPLDRGRLYYLVSNNNYTDESDAMMDWADNNRFVMQQTVLERPTEFCTLVEKFLESLPSNTNND